MVEKNEQAIMIGNWEHNIQMGPGIMFQYHIQITKYTWQIFEGRERLEKIVTAFANNRYFGESVNNAFQGPAKSFIDGIFFDGHLFKNKKVGTSVQIHDNWDVYEGSFDEFTGYGDGEGVYTKENGQRYQVVY